MTQTESTESAIDLQTDVPVTPVEPLVADDTPPNDESATIALDSSDEEVTPTETKDITASESLADVEQLAEALVDEIQEEVLPKNETHQKMNDATTYLAQTQSETTESGATVENLTDETTIPAASTIVPSSDVEPEKVTVVQAEPKKSSQVPTKDISSTPKTPVKKRVPWSKKKKKILWYTVAVIAIISVSGGVYYAHEQEVERQAQAALVQKEQAVTSLEKEIQTKLSTSTTTPIIKQGVTAAELKDYQAKLAAYKGIKNEQETAAFLETLITQQKQAETLNKAFNIPVLVDGKVVNTAYVTDTQNFNVTPLTGTSDFDKAYNDAVALGQKQVEQAKQVQTAVASIVAGLKDGKLADSVTTQTYTNVTTQIDSLQDDTLKTKLQKELVPVKAALDKREADQKAAKTKAEQEAATKAAQAQAAQQAQTIVGRIAANTQYSQATQILSPTTPTNKDNRPIIASRQSDLNDTNSKAWEWGSGVYDTVINECIKRGYIVAGGFYLQRARIENGEGYYNLYATSNQSSLLKNTSEKALPLYIATINAKTGYFKGNGSN